MESGHSLITTAVRKSDKVGMILLRFNEAAYIGVNELFFAFRSLFLTFLPRGQ